MIKRRVRSGATSVLIAIVLATAVATVLRAQHESKRRVPGEWSRESSPSTAHEPFVRLSYVQRPWKFVLKDVSDQMGVTLVMDRVPDGRWSRRDRTLHSYGDALRILNHSLERDGFRLIPKGQYLVVLDVRKARARYARPRLPEPADQIQAGRNDLPRRRHRAATVNRPARTDTGRRARPLGNSRRIQQVSAAEDDNFRRTPDQADAEKTRLTTIRSVPIHNRDAVGVARTIFAVYRKHSELIRRGPLDLPSIRVYLADSDQDGRDSRPVQFTLGIDKSGNRLVIDAPRERTRQLEQLIRRLDRAPRADGEDVRVMSGNESTRRIAMGLEVALNRIALNRKSGEPGQAGISSPEPAEKYQRSLPDGDTADTASANDSHDVKDMLGSLKGDVNVEALPDLGALILRGNEADLKALEAVIREIERLSAGTIPEIHLLNLQFVNSEALSELLTSVYDRLTELRQRDAEANKGVAFFPLVQPNAILILAPRLDLESILELAAELDKPTDPSTEFEVFPLRNAIALQVVTAIESFYAERPGLGTRVHAVADSRTNSVIVQGSPREMKEIVELIRRIDRDGSGSVSQVKVFRLRNAIAEELADVINEAVQSVLNPPGTPAGQAAGFTAGQGQTSQDLREVKSVVLEFLSAEELIRSGILADVRVNADARSNTLIVTAPEASMRLMAALITELDKPTSTVAEIRIFTLENGDATQAVELLTTLFEDTNQEDDIGIRIAGAEDASSGLVPLRFTSDVRTNSVIAIGGAEALRVVEAILLKLDESDVRQRQNEVIRLKNIPVFEVADAINNFLQAQRELAELDSDLVSNVELLEREVIVVAEPETNSLLISATPRYYNDIHRIIDELDTAPPQVIIQALLVEVVLENTDEFGVELGFQDSVLFDRSLVEDLVTITQSVVQPNQTTQENETIISQTGSPGFLFNNSPLGNNTSTGVTSTGSVGTQGLSNFTLGRSNSELGFGGFVFSASSDSVSVLMRALAARRTTHVLSRPQIRTVDNQEATIQVGQRVPVADGVTTNLGVVSPNIVQEDAGIILRVLPRITPDGMIVMVVAAEKSEFGGGVPVFTDVNTGQVITAPVKELATAISTVSVPNGQTVVMGGMITKSDETIERKVPWLGDIPWLGVPFRYDGTTTRRGELLIFLTPRIIYNDADSELIKQVEAERLHFLEQEAEEIHGPIYSVPAESRRMSPGFLIQEHQGPTGLMPPPFESPPASPPALQPEESPSDVPPPPAATDGSLLPDETLSTDRSRDAGPWDLSRTNRQRRGETEKSDSRQRMQQMPVAKQTPASRPAKRKRGRSVLSRLVPMLPSR